MGVTREVGNNQSTLFVCFNNMNLRKKDSLPVQPNRMLLVGVFSAPRKYISRSFDKDE